MFHICLRDKTGDLSFIVNVKSTHEAYQFGLRQRAAHHLCAEVVVFCNGVLEVWVEANT